jgi:hypothetical protein
MAAKKTHHNPTRPARPLSPHPGDALINGEYDFPISGDGTAEKDVPPPDLFVSSDLSGAMGDPVP